jgi:hypothetical protein
MFFFKNRNLLFSYIYFKEKFMRIINFLLILIKKEMNLKTQNKLVNFEDTLISKIFTVQTRPLHNFWTKEPNKKKNFSTRARTLFYWKIIYESFHLEDSSIKNDLFSPKHYIWWTILSLFRLKLFSAKIFMSYLGFCQIWFIILIYLFQKMREVVNNDENCQNYYKL